MAKRYSRTINWVWKEAVPESTERAEGAARVANYLASIKHWYALEEHLQSEAELEETEDLEDIPTI